MNTKIASFLEERRPETPCLVLDLDVVAGNYQALAAAMPDSRIFYAVKANPAPEILSLLAALGSCFDTASVVEIRDALAAGATPDRVSFGNTIKKRVDIATAYALGVRLFAFDSEAELRKIAEVAPGARVFCRILTSGEGAEWPLSRKFGCEPSMARELLAMAPGLGLDAYGVSFHVGSQQRDTGAWDQALESAAGHLPRPGGPGHRAEDGQSRRRLPDQVPQGGADAGGLWPRHRQQPAPAISATACPRPSSSRAAAWSAMPA